VLELAQCDGFADGKNSQQIPLDVIQNWSAADQDPIFELEMKTAVVQIDRAGDAEVIITQDGLGMQEPGRYSKTLTPAATSR